MTKSFWNNNHDLTPIYDELYKELVPSSGKAETVAGELLRATSKIYYDAFNNGFGNNTSGAYNFLDETLPKELTDNKSFEFVAMHCNSAHYGSFSEKEYDLMDNFSEIVIQYIIDNPELKGEPNDIDMYDYQEPDYYEEEGCEGGSPFLW